MKLTIGYLYGDIMNIYGDTGNIIALQKRCQWRGIEVEKKLKGLKEKIKTGEIDLYFFGGGQDQQQELVAKDLMESGKGKVIKSDVERGVPLLSICGGYQLLGDYYQPHQGPKLEGIGIFPAYTVAGNTRMIGNIVVRVQGSGDREQQIKTEPEPCNLYPVTSLVGFENHSGQTFLKEEAVPLGQVIKGHGNNGQDGTEGCIYKNAIGCYMHGSLLPKNPQLADWLIQKALEVKYGKEIALQPLDDSLETQAHNFIVSKLK